MFGCSGEVDSEADSGPNAGTAGLAGALNVSGGGSGNNAGTGNGGSGQAGVGARGGVGGSNSGGSPNVGGNAGRAGASNGGALMTGGTTSTAGSGTAGGQNAGNGGAQNAGNGGRQNAGNGGAQNAGNGGRQNAGNGGSAAGSGPVGGMAAGGAPDPGRKFVGNITTNNTMDSDGKVFARHWDQITPENAGKWGSVQSTAGAAFNWRTLDAIYDYAQKNNILFKQHAFVWGSQQPGGTISEADVKRWISEFCTRYPNTPLIDVVNEPPPHTTPNYANAIGGGTNGNWQWITNSFKWARESCPNSILILNDYNNIEYGDQVNHFINIVKTVKAAGAPVDAVGAQAHALDDRAVTFEIARGFIERLHNETDLPVYITEFDISTTDDNAQLDTYKKYIPFFLETEYIKGVTIWGWIYGRTWSQAPNSGLVRNGTPRPAMTWLMQQLGRPTP